jgi:hypothetical protein
MRTSLLVLVLACLPALTGCPGSLGDPQSFRDGEQCPDVPEDILAMSCAGSGCHEAYMPAAQLDLITPGVADRLVGGTAKGEGCLDMGVLAVPEDPEASLLYLKLTGSPPCGEPMPLLGTALTAKEISCVKDWIAEQEPAGADAGVPAPDAGASDGG